MLQPQIISQLEHCADEIDKLLSENEIKNLDVTLVEICERLKKEIKWFVQEAPKIAKEMNYSLDISVEPEFPRGYVVDRFGEDLFDLYKKGDNNKPNKLVGTFSDMSKGNTRKRILKEICKFQEQESVKK